MCFAVAILRRLWRKSAVFAGRKGRSIGAVLWQPVEFRHVLGCELNAVFLSLQALLVDAAAAGVDIQKTAGDRPCVDDPPRINGFFKTAFTAAPADSLPARGFVLIV